MYEKYQQTRNTNGINLATEYLNNPRQAKERYGGTPLYEDTLAEINEALNAKVVQVRQGSIALYSIDPTLGLSGAAWAHPHPFPKCHPIR